MVQHKKKIVLVVDDEKDVRDVLSEFLQGKGFRVLTAEHGKAAIELLKKQKPDLMILDLLMPVMDGFAVLKFVKTQSKFSDIPVIMLTIKSDPEHLGKGIFLQADFYLPKPFKLANLLNFINLLVKDK